MSLSSPASWKKTACIRSCPPTMHTLAYTHAHTPRHLHAPIHRHTHAGFPEHTADSFSPGHPVPGQMPMLGPRNGARGALHGGGAPALGKWGASLCSPTTALPQLPGSVFLEALLASVPSPGAGTLSEGHLALALLLLSPLCPQCSLPCSHMPCSSSTAVHALVALVCVRFLVPPSCLSCHLCSPAALAQGGGGHLLSLGSRGQQWKRYSLDVTGRPVKHRFEPCG